MRIRDWYFQGWERRGEAGRSVLVYTGEYYALPDGGKRPKAVCAGLASAIVTVYLTVSLRPTAGGMWRIAAIPQLLELIPLIYLVMGAACLLRAPARMTFRDWYASWRRMEHAALWSAVFTSLMTAAELAFLVTAERPEVLKELIYLLGELCCGALSAGLGNYIHKHPCPRSMDGQVKE